MQIGDSFTQLIATGNPGMRGSAKLIYELVSVHGHLAEFQLRGSSTLESGSVGGREISKGRAVFDMEKGIWTTIQEDGDGTAKLPGGLSIIYKLSKHKEIARAEPHIATSYMQEHLWREIVKRDNVAWLCQFPM